MYVHLHGHSTFSFLEAIGKPAKIVAKAKELAQPAIAITDYNGMYGTVKFLQAAKDESIKAILGVELGFVLDAHSFVQKDQIGNIVILAQTDEGYLSLMELISYANTLGIKDKPKIDLATLKKFSQGIIVFFGGLHSWIGKMILRDEKYEKMVEIVGMIQDAVGASQVFLELIAQDYTMVPDLALVNQRILKLSEELGIECIVDNDYHYIKAADREAWEVALDIKDGKKIYDSDRRQIKGQFHIMSEEELRMLLHHNGYVDGLIDRWIATNVAIADSITAKVKLGQTLFPNYESPENIKVLYQTNKDLLLSE